MDWPLLRGFDYRYGFPLLPHIAEQVEKHPEALRAELLAQLEAVTFAEVVRGDLARLPVAD